MLGSRVCWQLVLGWALLLNQPAFGNPDASEELPLAELEEPVSESQEPEEPVPVSEEPEQPVPESQKPVSESQEPEEPVPVSEEPEQPVPESQKPVSESQEPEEPVPVSEEPEQPVPESQKPVSESQEPEVPVAGESVDPSLQEMMKEKLAREDFRMIFGPPDEELEERAKKGRGQLERARDEPASHSINYFKRIALYHYNQKSNYHYRSYEDGKVKVKKAIGRMVYVTFLLVKTNCTKEEGEALSRRHTMFYDDEEMEDNPLSMEKQHCEVPPVPEQEIEECTFTLFRDARRLYSEYVVTHHSCTPLEQQRENES